MSQGFALCSLAVARNIAAAPYRFLATALADLGAASDSPDKAST